MEAIGPVVQVVGRLLWSVSETKFLAVFKLNNFDSKGHLSCLNGFMVLHQLYGQYVKEMLFISKLIYGICQLICQN